jgi:D-glycero-alpha-D-manno-heptose-7-phosphate kinase
VIVATSRCRVDLAGGTLDIWPIGLLHPGSVTVNVAVELTARARLRTGPGEYVVRQDDRRWAAATAEALLGEADTALCGHVALHHRLPPVEIELESASPRGAGLGASSALTVALLAAAEALVHGTAVETPERRAAIARDLEARLMGLPTGLQDHLPGQLGGALAIEHEPGGERIRRLEVDLSALGERLLVAYTGQSHFSAGNNWSILRRRFERDPATTGCLDEIRDVARELPAALEAADWPRAGRLVGREWHARRRLAPEVSTDRVEALLSTATELGAWGGKACGAGGGGSIAVLVPPARRAAVEQAWTRAGAELLAAAPSARALEVVREPT